MLRQLCFVTLVFLTLAGARAYADTPPEPIRTEVLPHELDVVVYQHHLPAAAGARPCLTFVSDGLARYGQAEIQFTLLRREGDSLPGISGTFNGIFIAILQQAKAGKLVGAGDYSALGPGSSLLGRRDFSGIVYAPALNNVGLPPLKATLQALIVTAREVEVARTHGALRVLGLLTAQTRFFPWPPWIDLDRRELPLPKGSLLSKAGAVYLPDGYASLTPTFLTSDGGTVYTLGPSVLTLWLGPRAIVALRESLWRLGATFALLPAPRADVQGLQSWGADGIRVNLQPGQGPAASYDQAMVILSLSDDREMLGPVEDGMGAVLSVEHTNELVGALRRGSAARMELADGNVLEIKPLTE